MLVPNQTIPVRWSTSNRDYYESIGYGKHNVGEFVNIKAEDLSQGSAQRVIVVCDYCGETYETIFASYIKGINKNGKNCCAHCTGKKTSEVSLERRKTEHMNLVREVCESRGYILITKDSEYTGAKMKIKYICPIHGECESFLTNFIRGHCCSQCGNNNIGDAKRFTNENVKNIIESVNNNQWLNYGEYQGIFAHNLQIRCGLCGNIFITALGSYIRANVVTCPSCSAKESKGEQRIRQYLEANSIMFEQEKRFPNCRDTKTLPLDFYLPNYNVIIEYDGAQHYTPVFGIESFKQTTCHDLMKNKYCEENNIKLIRIPYSKKNDIEDILDEAIQVKDIV